jgi:uncharacterized Fe-S cluster-containing radical SAM superfamily protein
MPNKLSEVFRVFSPIDADKGRKPNAAYGFDFDIYKDVLSDSPVTIAAKMKGKWEDYNHHAIIQSGVCNFRCWYCYVDYRFLSGRIVVKQSAAEVLDQFLSLRDRLEARGKQLNVLRISGGEPLLVPDLTLACLEEIRRMSLHTTVCVKTETNLSPLITVDGRPLVAHWSAFEEFSQHQNFLLHPTFHGISGENLNETSAVDPDAFEVICEGLQNLLAYRVDFYPSFGANTVPVNSVVPFFRWLRKVNTNLPLRFAVRHFRFDYNAISMRDKERNQIFDSAEVIRLWDALLRDEYGVGYAEIPRHLVSLY